jgi:predicted transcriptional regulator
MSEERPIFEEVDFEAEAASLARAREDVAAGRVVPHAKVAEWLRKWAVNPDLRMPREWLK